MIISFLKSMLGPLSPLLDYVLENNQVVNIVLLTIIAIYVAGRLQLRNINQKSELLVIELGREFTNQKPHITKGGLYKKIYPKWAEVVGSWGVFVPSKHDIYPIRVRPETVGEKMGFSPEWIANVLSKNGIHLDGTENTDNISSVI